MPSAQLLTLHLPGADPEHPLPADVIDWTAAQAAAAACPDPEQAARELDLLRDALSDPERMPGGKWLVINQFHVLNFWAEDTQPDQGGLYRAVSHLAAVGAFAGALVRDEPISD